MKIYSFAPISAREYPTVRILDHPYIWGGVGFCLNVSEKPYSEELKQALSKYGVQWLHCPVSEDNGIDWNESILRGLPALYNSYKEGKKMIVHCDMGNNRSKSFVEAFYFLLKGEQYPDEYNGEYNHLIYNSKIGHLPPMEELEQSISAIRRNLETI